jgi:5'(3')-deoxyribonucleotidase/GNAT superfamily N-acetyltransferase
MSKLFSRTKTSGWETAHGFRTYLGNKPSSYGKPGGWTPGSSTITRKDVGPIDPKLLLQIPGENGEERYLLDNGDGTFQSAKYGDAWEDMVNWAREELAKPDTLYTPMIVKKQNGDVRVWEGNHRIRAAVQAGLPTINVEFVYWAFSEDNGLIFDPETRKFDPRGRVQPRMVIPREAKMAAQTPNFRIDHVDSYSGQDNYVLRAFIGHAQVGACEFVVFRGEVSVSMLSTHPSFRRQGIGRALLRRLQAEFPGQEIKLGMQTDQGGKLINSMTFQEEPSEHAALFAEQTKLKAEEAQLQKIADDYYEQNKPLTPEFEQQMARLNEVNDRLWELDQQLWDKSGTKRLIASHKPRLFLDMDGVLADYCRAADEQGHAYEDFLMVPGCFRDLPFMPGAREAFLKLLVLAGPENIYVLSTPAHDRYAESVEEKSDWLDKMLPEVLPDHRIFTADKGDSGQAGDILVDDHPDWNGADKFPGQIIHFKGPETWDSVFDAFTTLNTKVASGWDAETTRWHARERAVGAKEVQQGLRQRFQQLIHGLYVQPGGQQQTLSQFLTRNPITELFRGTDRSVRLMGNRIRTELDAFLQQHYTPQQVQQFKEEHGANVSDWLIHKIIAAKTARASDELLTKRYGATPEQIALAKQVDSGDYLEWVVKQLTGVRSKAPNQTKEDSKVKTPTIRLPEDAPKLRKELEMFTKLKRSPRFTGEKNILNYSPQDLFTITEEKAPEVSQKEQVREMHHAATIWTGQVDHPDLGMVAVTVLQPTTAEEVATIGGGPGIRPDGRSTDHTAWCTTDPDTAESYLSRGGIYIIKVDGRNYAQYHPQSGQFMDVTDHAIPTMKVPDTGLQDLRFINDAVCNAAMIGADLPKGHFSPIDPLTSPPSAVVAWYAAQDVDIPDNILDRIHADPVATALMITYYGFEEDDDADLQIVMSSPEACRTYFQWFAAKLPYQGLLFPGGAFSQGTTHADPERFQVMLRMLQVVEQSPMESASLITWFLHQKTFGLEIADQQQWFTDLKASVKQSPEALKALCTLASNWTEMTNALISLSPSQAIELGARRRKAWPELEAKIIADQDQHLALDYLHRVALHPADEALRTLAFSSVPTDEKDLWTAGADLASLIQWLKKVNPIVPYRKAKNALPGAAEDIIWANVREHGRTGLLGLWAAWALNDQQELRQQALETIAADPHGQPVIAAYLADTEYRRAKILEPKILQMLEHGTGSNIEAILYVAHQYAPQVKGSRDAAAALRDAMQGRPLAASMTPRSPLFIRA